MFSILQKPHDSVTAEDLETLQNELEKYLVDIVTRSWDLETELDTLNSGSPGPSGPSASAASSTLGKLRNSLRVNNSEHPESSLDALKNGSSNTDGTTSHNVANGINSADESISSEDSCTRSVDDDISYAEPGSQAAQSQNSGASSKKRSLKDSSNDRPSKRFRQNSSNSLNLSAVSYQKRPSQSKHRSKIVPSKFRSSTDESRINKKQPHKNEAPDKLWPFVEQFCVAPTEEQIRELEEMVKALDNDKDYFKVPPLGKRDGVKDSPSKVESLINETSNSSTAPAPSSSTGSKKKTAKNRKEVAEKGPDAGLGALTQRLVSSFIESPDETSASNGPEDIAHSNSKKKNNNNSAANNSTGGNSKSKSTKKNIDLSKAKNLEQRIRQELEEHDILNQQDDLPYSSEDDEILRELIASQHELLSIQNQNKEFMNRLLKRARNYSELESEREKLREANADVIAAYHKLIQARQRKRNPTKKEKDVAWRALKVQEAIFDKCDELYLTGLAKQD